MNQKRAFALAALLGLVAVLLGWFLLAQGRRSEIIAGVTYKARDIDPGPMLHLVDVLASDALQGRAAGTPGNEAARGFIRKRFEDVGLTSFSPAGWEHPVTILPRAGLEAPAGGANLIGWVPGKSPGTGPFILITAHYDHLGVKGGEIYNGADDNASGVAMLTALADHFVRTPPQHDILFAALDGEEVGLLGARALMTDATIPMERAALNINLGMVGRSDAGELHVAGTSHTPQLAALLTGIAPPVAVELLMGHDRAEDGPGDWTNQSDHAVFHQAGIPFLYFGVEDHPGYHQPADDFAAITPDFFVRAADTLVSVTRAADVQLAEIYALRREPAQLQPTQGPAE